MSSQAQGIPIQFNASTDVNNFFVPVSTGTTDPDGIPLTAFQIKTVPQKSLLFNITGSISGLSVGFGGSTSTSGSVQLLKAPNPQPTRNFIRETDYTLLGESVFIKQAAATIDGGSGQFDFSATGSVEFNDLLYLRVIGFTNTTVPRNPSAFTASLHSFRITSEPTGSAKELVVEPYFTSPFYGTDCDVTYGNASQPVSNPFLQDIDYNSGGITPTNNIAIISGTAAKGTVPESYYTSLAQTTIRYKGSKNQSSNFNVYNPQAGTSSFGDNINIGTYGQTPSVSNLDTVIYEFEWGGGTTPEILDYGAVKLGKILQVSSPEQVKTINPSDGSTQILVPSRRGTTLGRARNYRTVVGASTGEIFPPGSVSTSSVDNIHFWLTSQSISDYTHILNGNNPINSEISMFMYPNSTAGSNPTLPSTTKILETNWGVPTISSYALTSSNSSEYGSINSGASPRRFISLDRDVHISKVTTDSNGFYQSANNPIKPNWATIGDQINIDLNNGERWFITLYNEFEFPNGQGDYNSVLLTGSLSPFNTGITQDGNGNYSDALGYKGVYEIAGVYDDFSNFNILTYSDFPNFGGIKKIGGGVANNSLGMLIWKAKGVGKGEFAIIQDLITGGVQAGAFTSKYVPNYITENFESITKTYGANQTG